MFTKIELLLHYLTLWST